MSAVKIEGNRNLQLVSNGKIQKNVKENEEANTKAEESGDVFKINTSSSELSEIFNMANQLDEVRYEKIKELKEKEAKGEYRVSGKDVVSKVLGEKLRDKFNH